MQRQPDSSASGIESWSHFKTWYKTQVVLVRLLPRHGIDHAAIVHLSSYPPSG